MESLSKGNELAFSELYNRYAKILLNYFYRRLWSDREKAEDFVQDLFTKIIQNPTSFDTNRNFKSWVFTVAGNMCKNEYKRSAVRSNTISSENATIQLVDLNIQPHDTMDEKAFIEELEKLLADMDEKHSEVFILRHFNQMSLKEIGDILSCNEGTVKSRLFYATKRIANELNRFNPALNR
jgi:RNA polymerase sigma-70 factor (ECF subfamily)